LPSPICTYGLVRISAGVFIRTASAHTPVMASEIQQISARWE
jgi:hypothetical protein